MDNYATACLFANETYTRDTYLYDGSHYHKTFDLLEIENKEFNEGLEALNAAEKEVLMAMAESYAKLYADTEGFENMDMADYAS